MIPRLFPLVALAVLGLSSAPRAQVPVWSQDGEAQDDRFGISVAGGGDFDGDGFDDVIVGSWKHNGLAGADTGKVYLYSGQTFGLLWFFDGEAAGDDCGFSVGNAGDVNGDGRPDVVAGAPAHNAPAGADSGKAYVLSGLDGSLLFSVDGETVGDRFGISVAGAGDVTGDGLAEIVVGADRWNGPGALDAGKAYVFAQSPTGPVPIWSWTGTAQQDYLGAAVGGAGDCNGDGRDDVVVGAWRANTPAGVDSGRIWVFSGLTGTALYTIDGESTGAAYGAAVSGAGDFDGDGRGDFAVGAWGQASAGGPFAGRAYIYAGLTGTPLLVVDGSATADAFGTAVAGLGDLDGDGFDEVAVGAPGQGGTTGRVYVYRGGAAPGLYFEQGGEAVADFFGTGLGSAGDMNNDGFGEVAAGGHYHNVVTADEGKAYAYSGVPTGVATFGSGCAGSLGFAPRIGATGVPMIGGPFEVHVSKTLAPTVVGLLLGASNTILLPSGLPLPLNLFFLGLPACDLLVSDDVLLFAVATGPAPGAGRTTFAFVVPFDPALVGSVVFLQGFAVDPGPLPLPFAMTRGLAATIQ